MISTSELRERVSEVTVLDVRYKTGGRSGPGEYSLGHVPGAVYVDVDTELASAPGAGGRHPLPETAVFEEAMRRAGVRQDRAVVVYDDWNGLGAGRAWWLLRFHGHPDTRVLDGGWAAWVADGGAVERGVHLDDTAGDFVARPGQMPTVEVDRVLDVPVLVDARAPERYRGETEPIDPVAGRIPGARNVPTSANLDANGRFRGPDEIKALYEAAGVPTDGSQEVAVYCGSGVTAVHDVIALETIGVRASLYPGSWSEWITDPDRPVATGAEEEE